MTSREGMQHMRATTSLRCAAILACLLTACSDHAAPPRASGVAGSTPAESIDPEDSTLVTTPAGLNLEVPGDWQHAEPTSSMQQARFTLPRAEGDDESPLLVVYYFGESGGSVDANMARWASEFALDDGSDPLAKARIERDSVGRYVVHTFDLSGRSIAETAPGSGVRVDKPGRRTLAAIAETPIGNFFLKMHGPMRSVAAQEAVFRTVIHNLTLAP